MQGNWLRRNAARIGVAAVPLFAGAFVVAVVAGAFRPGIGITTYAEISTVLSVLDVSAGAGLVATGALAWILRQRAVGALAMGAGICWFGADWAGAVAVTWGLRQLAFVASLLTLPLLAHLVLRASHADTSRTVRRALVIAYASLGTLGLAWMAAYVPWADPDCLALCGTGGEPFGSVVVARWLAAAWQILTAAIGIALATWAVARYAALSRVARRTAGRTLLPAVAIGASWTSWAVALLLPSSTVPPTGPVLISMFVLRAFAVLILSAGLAWWILDGRRTLRSIRRIANDLSPLPGGGSLRAALATALGDPGLELVFPLPDGTGFVNTDGATVLDPSMRPDTHRTPIADGGRTVAVAIGRGGGPTVPLQDDMGDAVRLAASNERLLAAVRHEVLELRASRARIVEAGDTARHALERDLHDGAQHRMLGVLHELSLARAGAAQSGDVQAAERLTDAIEAADDAIESLRRLARGIHPATLTEAGLLPALEALADEAPLPLEIDAPEGVRFPAEVEATAWRVVAQTVVAADRLDAAGVSARVRLVGEILELDLEIDGASSEPDTVALEDRVGAVGGSVRVRRDNDGVTRVHVGLPCA